MLVFLLGFAIFLNLWMIGRSPGNDAYEWLVAGREILRGGVPYRDFFVHVGPLTGYIMAFVFRISKPHILAAAIAFATANLMTAAGLYGLARRWCENSESAIAAGFYLLAAPFFGGSEMYMECFAALFGVWGFFYLAREGRGPFMAGISLFLAAFLTKQTAIIYPVFWGVSEICCRRAFRKPIIGAALFAGGFILVSLYYFSKGVLKTFLYDFFIFNFVVSPTTPRILIVDLVLYIAPWLFALTVLGAFIYWKEKTFPSFVPLIAAVFFLLCVTVPFPHYFLLGLPFAALLAAKGLAFLNRQWSRAWVKAVTVLLIISTVPTGGRIILAAMRPFGVPPVLAELLQKTHLPVGSVFPDSVFEDLGTAAEVRKVLPPARLFYTESDSRLYYFYLDEKPPSSQHDTVDSRSWINDPATFHNIDTILLFQHRRFPDQPFNPARPSYVDGSFSETRIPFREGKWLGAVIYHREVNPAHVS